MNRSDIGDYLGLTMKTVCRRLTQLRHDGTIAIRDRRALRTADRRQVIH